jgi:hypothetical protein
MAVSVQPDESGSSLFAFIAPKQIDGDSVKKSLSKRVPSYMIPSSIYCLDRLPLNTNDKVDHKTIRATMGDLISQAHSSTSRQKSFYLETPPDSESSVSESSELEFESPSTVRTITKIWKAILGLSAPPSLSDNFFDIGGNRFVFSSGSFYDVLTDTSSQHAGFCPCQSTQSRLSFHEA